MSEVCEATQVATGIDCGEPAAGLYRGDCGHGHVRDKRLCAVHAEPLVPLWCRECFTEGREADVALTLLDRAAMPWQVS